MADWTNFDIERAYIVQAAITDYNQSGEGNEMAVPGYVQAKTKQAGANVNVRGGPSLKHAPITTISTGTWVKRLPGSTISADGYTWANVAVDKDASSHVHGWVAEQVIEV